MSSLQSLGLSVLQIVPSYHTLLQWITDDEMTIRQVCATHKRAWVLRHDYVEPIRCSILSDQRLWARGAYYIALLVGVIENALTNDPRNAAKSYQLWTCVNYSYKYVNVTPRDYIADTVWPYQHLLNFSLRKVSVLRWIVCAHKDCSPYWYRRLLRATLHPYFRPWVGTWMAEEMQQMHRKIHLEQHLFYENPPLVNAIVITCAEQLNVEPLRVLHIDSNARIALRENVTLSIASRLRNHLRLGAGLRVVAFVHALILHTDEFHADTSVRAILEQDPVYQSCQVLYEANRDAPVVEA